jgi:hypothetical protein
MTLRANGFCFLRFVLLARSIARLTSHVSDQTLSYFPTANAAGAFAIGVGRQRSLVGHAIPRNCPG